MLYQLSYLGAAPNAARGERRFIVRRGGAVQPPCEFCEDRRAARRRLEILPNSRASAGLENAQMAYFGSSGSSSSSLSRAGMA